MMNNDSKTSFVKKLKLSSKFKIKDLGHQYLGMPININRSKNNVLLDQRHLIEFLLEKIGVSGCNSVDIPKKCDLELAKSS